MRSMRHQVAQAIWIVAIFCLMLLPAYAAAEVDITDKVEIIKGRMVTDRATGDALIDVSVRNVSSDVLLTPVRVAITSVSSADVLVADFDGVTSEGFPFYEYENSTGQLLSSETIAANRWRFENPTKARFTYTYKVIGFVPDKAEVVGPSGGIIETDTDVVLEIPSGSVLEPTTFTVTRVNEEKLEISETIDNAYLLGAAEFGPSGQQFKWPVKVTLPIKENLTPGTELPLYIYSEDTGNYLESEFTCMIDDNGASCTGEVSHFTSIACVMPVPADKLWRFGEHHFFSLIRKEYLGNYAYFLRDTIFLGPRLPNENRNISGGGNLSFGLPPIKKEAVRLYGIEEEDSVKDNLSLYNKEPVLFIHGYTAQNAFGGGYGTWGNFISLVASLQIEDREYIPFEFQWRTNSRFQDVTEDLFNAIQKIYNTFGNKKVHLVAHSFGGVLARTLLQNYYPDNVSLDASHMVASLTTIATPHSGIAPASNLHDVDFPKGRDSFLHSMAKQISVHQMGENVLLPYSDLKINSQPGEIAAALAKGIDPEENNTQHHMLPRNVPIQSAIGLTAKFVEPLYELESGDKLISYEGQRFHPRLTLNEDSNLLLGENPFNNVDPEFYVFEKLLGLNNAVNLASFGQFSPYVHFTYPREGYKHSPAIKTFSPLAVYSDSNFVDCHNIETCYHDSFLSVKYWLERYTSNPEAFNEITRYFPVLQEPVLVDESTNSYQFSAQKLDQLINHKTIKYCIVINNETIAASVHNTCGTSRYDDFPSDAFNPEWPVEGPGYDLEPGYVYSWTVFAVNPYNMWSQAEWWTLDLQEEEVFVTISGQVVDSSTNQGISGAVVSTSLDSMTATTDALGAFSLQTSTEANYSSTPYIINISAEGYETFSSEGVWGDHPENQSFYLTPIITLTDTVWDDYLDIGVPFYNVFFEDGEWKIIAFELTSGTMAQVTFEGTTYNGTWAVYENGILNITFESQGESYWKLLGVYGNRLNVCFSESFNGLSICDGEFFYLTLEDAQTHPANIPVTISGGVVDANTNLGISGAVISTSLDENTVTTDSSGSFFLQTSTTGNYSITPYTLNISFQDYETFSLTLPWGDHAGNQLIKLIPNAAPVIAPYVTSVPRVGYIDEKTVLNQAGYGFTPSGGITLHFIDPNGLHSTIQKTADPIFGSYEHTYQTHNCSAVGPWEYYAVDEATGIRTDSILITIVGDNSNCGISAGRLTDTGQTQCYSTSGTLIDCAGTGQDGEFSINPLSYADNGNGTIIDNVTNLVWQQADDGIARTWQNAVWYCENLTLGGSDWRLPTVKEFTSIIDFGRSSPAIDPIFILSSVSSAYWTFDVFTGNKENAWAVISRNGGSEIYSKEFEYFTRCVSE